MKFALTTDALIIALILMTGNVAVGGEPVTFNSEPNAPHESSRAMMGESTSPRPENRADFEDPSSPVGKAEEESEGALVIPGPKTWYGFLEMRPSYTSHVGEFHTEDTAQIGYRFSPRLKATYIQYFNTRLYDPSGLEGKTKVYLQDGWFYAQVDHVWASDDERTTISLRETIVPPTDPNKAQRGYIASVRSYFILNHKTSNLYNTDFWIVPMWHGYSRPGTTTASFNEANRGYEMEFIFSHNFNITEKITFQVPIIWESVKYRNYSTEALFNDRWVSLLWVWPQITYNIDPTTQVGLAYYSDNLLNPDLSGTSFEKGFRRGIVQAIMNVML